MSIDLLPAVETDMTLFFRGLADVSTAAEASDEERLTAVADADYDPSQRNGDPRDLLAAWLRDRATRNWRKALSGVAIGWTAFRALSVRFTRGSGSGHCR